MKQYDIVWWENKVSAKGTSYARCTIKDETGAEYQDVAIFSSFPDYANLKAGNKVTGELKKTTYNGKDSYILEYAKLPTTGTTGAYKGQQIAKAQETKAQYVAVAQANTSHAVKTASTMTHAVNLAIAEYNGWTASTSVRPTLEFLIEKWRKYVWENWEVDEKKYNPF